jgi:hypothetical protein
VATRLDRPSASDAELGVDVRVAATRTNARAGRPATVS